MPVAAPPGLAGHPGAAAEIDDVAHVGRLPVTANLDPLDTDTLVKILLKPRNALIKQYQRLFELEDVTLTFQDEAIQAIAERSVQRKTGARGLRAVAFHAVMI